MRLPWRGGGTKCFNFLVLGALTLLSNGLAFGQEGDFEACFFAVNPSINCNSIVVGFNTPNQPGTHFWDFGDGTTSNSAPPVTHTYVDVNPYLNPITVTHTVQGITCTNEVNFPGIFLGTGCGSNRKVSEMITANLLPAGTLASKDLYIFGNLEVDVPYVFDACNIFISGGGKIVVKSGNKLTLKGGTVLDANAEVGVCEHLWNGIEVYSSATLETDVATIKNAYMGIRAIKSSPSFFPVLNLKSTNFERDFIGIYSAEGGFLLSVFRNNTFLGSGNADIYALGACNPPLSINGIPYSRKTYCGIYFNGTAGGDLFMPNKTTNNVFQNLQTGIVALNASATIYGSRFENIAFLPAAPALFQGTSINFITNFGKKALNVYGLGKSANQTTINNCERGIYAETNSTLVQVNIVDCKILEVQNGIEMTTGPAGDFRKGTVKDNYIACTKYLPNIKQRSIGILWTDPNNRFSDFTIEGNDILVDQPEAYTPNVDMNILPTAINAVCMQNQAITPGMILLINRNVISLIKGHQGIVVENVANTRINENTITHDNVGYLDPAEIGIWVLGGFMNTVGCNTATQLDPSGTRFVGFACEASPNMTMTQNTADNALAAFSFVGDNGTSTFNQFNNLNYTFPPPPNTLTGLYYNLSQTGPQYMHGNNWNGDFDIGALFATGLGSFPFCNSLYHVSQGANIANGINPVMQGNAISCNGIPTNWFTVLELDENDFDCTFQSPQAASPVKNQTDVNLAGGNLQSLSAGFRWSSALGLFGKFTEHPNLIAGDPVIGSFLQAQQGQPVANTYSTRIALSGLESSVNTGLKLDIQNLMAQLVTNEANLTILLEATETDPQAIADYQTLSSQNEALAQSLQSLMGTAAAEIAANATTLRNSNNAIACTDLPCQLERTLTNMYFDTRFIAARALTANEQATMLQIANDCPRDAGNAVYLARAWYYLETGTMVSTNCGSYMPPLVPVDRNDDSAEKTLLGFQMVPNPAHDLVELKLAFAPEQANIVVMDIWGRPVLQQHLGKASSCIIPTTSLSNGIYLVSVKTAEGFTSTQKLVVQH